MFSCAEEEYPTTEELQETSFESWMALYAPDAIADESGIYIEVLESGPAENIDSPEENEWVRVKYTGYEMVTGNVFITRDEDVAKYQDTYQTYTHYNADYLQCVDSIVESSDYYTIDGIYYAVTQMVVGDIWRVYIPPYMAYEASGYTCTLSGYEGQYALGSTSAVYFDLELCDIVPDVETEQLYQIQAYATNTMGLALVDSVAKDMYFRSLEFREEDSYALGADSTVDYYYVGRFLDGFVFDTNIADTAIAHDIYDDDYLSKYEIPASATICDTDDDGNATLIAGMDTMLCNMHYGESATAIIPSSLGYGDSGSYPEDGDGGTTFQTYTPIVFDVFISPKNGDGSYEFPYKSDNLFSLEEEDGVWLYGYAVGVITGEDYSEAEFGDDIETDVYNNILFSSSSYVTNYALTIPIELADGPIQDSLNRIDNPDLYLYPFKVYGDVRYIYGTLGLTNVSNYKKIQ